LVEPAVSSANSSSSNEDGGDFELARWELFARLHPMGAKYVPTIKDLKAGQRFQQKQLVQSKFIKPAGKPPAKKPKK
jgi:hypothetical protein